jgi:hypothetical protein
MTPESIDKWSGVFEVSTVVLTLTAAMAGALAWRFSSWSSDARSEALKTFQTNAQVEIAASQTKMKQLETESNEAKAAIAKSNENARQAQKDAALATERAAATQLQAENLKASLAWRLLNLPTAKVLIDALTLHPGSVRIDFVENDPETTFLAIQLQKIFVDSKWTCDARGAQFSGTVAFGIFIPNNSTTASVDCVRSAFTAAHIPFSNADAPMTYSSLAGGNLSLGPPPPLTSGQIQIFLGCKFPPQ